MPAQTSMLHVRIDDATKHEATIALNAMGLSVSDAVRLLLRRVAADKAFPFELKVPNAQTRVAMAEADGIVRARRGRFENVEGLVADLEKNGGE